MSRTCHDCGATSDLTAFPGNRKLRGGGDRCVDCKGADDLAAFQRRVAARRQEISVMRQKGRYRAPKAHWSAPLFQRLAPGGKTQENRTGVR